MKRFYREVHVIEQRDGFAVALDGKPTKTPGGAALLLPVRALADAIAGEWGEQGERVVPSSMPLTALACAATDRVSRARGAVMDHALGFGRSDVLCYRAESPAELRERQRKLWDPLLEWARAECGVRLIAAEGIDYIEQPADALVRMQELVGELDDFRLAAFDAAATATGSFVLAVALVRGRLPADEVFAAAHIEELYQAETWGRDSEAEARRSRLHAELEAVQFFVAALVAE